jgi:hypothetical protein
MKECQKFISFTIIAVACTSRVVWVSQYEECFCNYSMHLPTYFDDIRYLDAINVDLEVADFNSDILLNLIPSLD